MVFALVPASEMLIGSSKIVKLALFPPLMVQVVSLIAPLNEMLPPPAVTANAEFNTVEINNKKKKICI
ncbi:hypothetical protein M2263_001425 [Providencia alcalifaciens]|nr:hypothetical protein [Providencia alcalifaciens]